MRATICMLLALVLTVGLLSGCAKTETPPTTDAVDIFENSMQKSDPSQDDVVNVLLVGNSGCYYYVEELHGIAKAAGISMRVCNLYYNGATVMQHWNWWKKDQTVCEYFNTDEKGRVKFSDMGLMQALQQQNWDVIGMCDGGQADIRASTPEENFAQRGSYLKDLYDLYRKEFPMSKLYWQACSPYEVGYNRKFAITSFEDQQADNALFREQAKLIAKELDIQWVPRGDAAQLARANPATGDNLTARLGINSDQGDLYHDGDIGGGQYLSACVWFEVLTGQSCIGNTWRPGYELSEEKIEALQQAAHEAVANMNN